VNSVGTGGAVTKVSAAKVATAAGIPTLLSATESLGAWWRGRPEVPGLSQPTYTNVMVGSTPTIAPELVSDFTPPGRQPEP
jgi:hypothetical protein